MRLPSEREVLAAGATFGLAALVGAASGALAAGFQALVDTAQGLVLGRSGQILDAVRSIPWWQRLLLPTFGALAAALLIRALAPQAQPFGIPGIMEAVSVRRRKIRGRPIVVRALASVAAIASGGSIGREGAIVQLAAALGSKTARLGRFDARRHALLLGCGVAAGMASAYNAPLAGAFFVMEVIMASFAIDVFAPIVVSSVFSALVMRAIKGQDAAVYSMPSDVSMVGFESLFLAIAIAIPAGVVAFGLQRGLRRATHASAGWRVPIEMKFALGGLGVGAIGIAYPEVFGNGYSATSEILSGRLALATIAALLVAKPLATIFSIGSGAPGGIFTPALLTGASLGALFAHAAGVMFPSNATPDAAFVVVGMASLIAGLTHAPIMSMVLLVELTQDLGLILPLTLATVASALVARWLARDSIFTEALRARGVPIDVGIEELTLRRIRVRDLIRSGLVAMPANAPLDEVLARFRETRLDVIYTVDPDGTFRGAIDLHDVKSFLSGERLGSVVIAADVMDTPPTASPDMSIAQVLELLDDPDREEIPVVDQRDGRQHLIGRLTRRDVLAAIDLEVLKSRTRSSRGAPFTSEREERWVELPRNYEIAELPIPKRLRHRTLKQSGLADAKGVTVISLVERTVLGEERKAVANLEEPLDPYDRFVVMGPRTEIDALRDRLEEE